MKTRHSVLNFTLVSIALTVMAFFTSAFPLQPRYAVVSSLSVILFALPSYYGLTQTFGKKTTIWLVILMSIFALILENIAILTGFPYGNFAYGALIGKQIGYVPWTVGFAWTPILFGAISITQKLQKTTNFFIHIGLAAVLMTALDIVLDPASVSLGFWIWNNPVGFYGVPWSNFGGWLLSSVLAVFTVHTFLKSQKIENVQFSPWTDKSFILILIFWTAICFFEELWVPGFFGIGLLFSLRSYFSNVH